MIFFGTIVNAIAVAAGGGVGLIIKNRIPARYTSIYFQAIALFVIAVGISMVYQMEHILIIVSSLIIGSFIGEYCRLEERVEGLSQRIKSRFNTSNERFTEGLITTFLLFCVGSLTIMGAVQEGVEGRSDLLLTKSMMDGFSSILLASIFGLSVALSSIPLLLFQGLLTLLAYLAADFFSEEMISAIKSVSGILLIGLGINLLEIKKIRILNMLPSILVVVLLLFLLQLTTTL